VTLEWFLVLSAVLFSIGLYGVLTKRNAIMVLMALEIMFNGVILAAVAMSRYVTPWSMRDDQSSTATDVVQMVLTGQVFAIFIIAMAAAEIALGLAIVMAVYRRRDTVDVTEVNLMRW
jgi:NADH:ubiquinone oxidoreductase subunit K